MAEEIKAKYDELEQVAARLAKQSQAIQHMLEKVHNSMNQLKTGWEGRGSEAFFTEMEHEVLPASTRLKTVLDEASHVTKEVSQKFKQAEQEASALFSRDVHGV